MQKVSFLETQRCFLMHKFVLGVACHPDGETGTSSSTFFLSNGYSSHCLRSPLYPDTVHTALECPMAQLEQSCSLI